jgi:2'-5' RNA ligase
MIFPNFENIDIIDKIRDKYDPLCNYVRPHITLVFPFESDISSSDLASHIKTALVNCKPFNLTMQGFAASVEPWSNYLFLNVTHGLENLFQLSKKLYTGILEKFKSDIYAKSYCPHLTVGNLNKQEDYEAILKDLEKEKSKFVACVNCVSVEIIGGDETSESEMTIRLFPVKLF